MRPGPPKKSAKLELLQGQPGKRGIKGRPDADQFTDDLKWFYAQWAYFDEVIKEERAQGIKSPTPAVWAAFKFRKMCVDIKAKLVGEEEQEQPKSRWAGLITSNP